MAIYHAKALTHLKMMEEENAEHKQGHSELQFELKLEHYKDWSLHQKLLTHDFTMQPLSNQSRDPAFQIDFCNVPLPYLRQCVDFSLVTSQVLPCDELLLFHCNYSYHETTHCVQRFFTSSGLPRDI